MNVSLRLFKVYASCRNIRSKSFEMTGRPYQWTVVTNRSISRLEMKRHAPLSRGRWKCRSGKIGSRQGRSQRKGSEGAQVERECRGAEEVGCGASPPHRGSGREGRGTEIFFTFTRWNGAFWGVLAVNLSFTLWIKHYWREFHGYYTVRDNWKCAFSLKITTNIASVVIKCFKCVTLR